MKHQRSFIPMDLYQQQQLESFLQDLGNLLRPKVNYTNLSESFFSMGEVSWWWGLASEDPHMFADK